MASGTSKLKKKAKGFKFLVHEPGLCSVLFAADGNFVVTAGYDGKANIFANDDLSGEDSIVPSCVVEVSKSSKGVSALAVSPRGDKFATGSLDHHVKLWNCPSGEFVSTFTRFQLPVRALAFNRTGSLLAAAGDEGTIKILDLTDPHMPTVAWACNQIHRASVISLSFDPTDEGLLASLDTEGTIIISGLEKSWNPKTVINGTAPEVDPDLCQPLSLSWQPGDGTFIAVPDRNQQVLFLDRDTFKSMKENERLTGVHMSNVALVSWSPNGQYLATVGTDGQVIVWEAKSRQDISCRKVSSQVCGLAWKPHGNAIVMVDVEGRLEVWDEPISSHMLSPTEGSKRHAGIDKKVIEDFVSGTSGAEVKERENELEDEFEAEESEAEGHGVKRKMHRLRKKSKEFKSAADHLEDSLNDLFDEEEVPSSPASNRKRKTEKRVSERVSESFYVTPMQQPFQPGSTQANETKKRFLSYNMLGSISSREEEAFAHVEIEFHDTNLGRIPPMTDYYGFTMAALHETGAVFANPKKGDKNPSTLLYRPFSVWAPNSEWSMRFSGEEQVECVAIGHGWAAAATNLHHLRLFSAAGVQLYIVSLCGPVVSMAGQQNLLVTVHHSSGPDSAGNQVLAFTVLDVVKRLVVKSGPLSISPSSTLTWLGFAENGVLATYDSKGVLRIFSTEMGGCWIPIFSCAEERKSSGEQHWLIGLNSEQIFVVVCKLPATEPQVFPRPVHTILPWSVPLAVSDIGADSIEKEFVHKSLLLIEAQAEADDAALEGQEDDLAEARATEMEAEVDKCILRLIAASCKANKLARAYELGSRLTLLSSLEGAVRLVSALRLSSLAERLHQMLKQRIEEENNTNNAADPPVRNYNDASKSPSTPDGRVTSSIDLDVSLPQSTLEEMNKEQQKEIVKEALPTKRQKASSYEGLSKQPEQLNMKENTKGVPTFSKVSNPFGKGKMKQDGEKKQNLFESLQDIKRASDQGGKDGERKSMK